MKLRSGEQAIFHRRGKSGLRVAYFLNRKADVPKRLNFVETVQRVVRDGFSTEFNRALQRALS